MTQNPKSPNFFIIGAPKCGTTAMAQYLAEHPQVFFCAPKEPFFWSTDHAKLRETHRLHSVNDYLKLFKDADPRKHTAIGEGSTNYMQSRVAIKEIVKFQPDARFIVMLRNPVDVAYGMHGELRRHFAEDEPDFEKAWALQQPRSQGEQLPKNDRLINQLQYQDVASFAPQLKRLFDLVPESRRLVLVFDDFVKDARRSYLQTLQFLGLEDDGRTEFPTVNPAGKYRLQLVGKLYQDPPAWLEPPVRCFRAWYAKQGGGIRHWVHSIVQKKASRESLRPEFREYLREVFRADIEETSALIGKDLTRWTCAGNTRKSDMAGTPLKSEVPVR
jgi:hypothetical protein